MSNRPTLAAVTMVYNDPDYIALWCRHYGRQLGARNCYILDHGSDDGSTDRMGGVNVIRLPRSPKDDVQRTRMISAFCGELLRRYDAVIHVDVDELLVADPRHYRDLADCAASMKGGVMNAIGFEVFHRPDEEPAIDIDSPVSLQRRSLWFHVALCKPALIREPVVWSPGFHSVQGPVAFDHLYLFHLRYFDRDRGLRRLAQTRSMAWADPNAGQHQRGPDATWLNQLTKFEKLRRENADLDPERAPLAPLLAKIVASQEGRENQTYRIAFDIQGQTSLVLPARFDGLF
jgi:hypothetical protein